MLIIIPFIQLFTRQMSDEERAREGGGVGTVMFSIWLRIKRKQTNTHRSRVRLCCLLLNASLECTGRLIVT